MVNSKHLLRGPARNPTTCARKQRGLHFVGKMCADPGPGFWELLQRLQKNTSPTNIQTFEAGRPLYAAGRVSTGPQTARTGPQIGPSSRPSPGPPTGSPTGSVTGPPTGPQTGTTDRTTNWDHRPDHRNTRATPPQHHRNTTTTPDRAKPGIRGNGGQRLVF